MVNVHGGEDTEDSDVRLEQVCAWAREEDEEDKWRRQVRTSMMCAGERGGRGGDGCA